MDYLTQWLGEYPPRHRGTRRGAGEVASGALRYLVRNLGATRFAEIAPEEFYVFTEVRPHSIQVRPGQRALRWPSNDFYYWNNPAGGRDLLLFLGREPNLRWAT